uniref:Uncharacterized protein n=1 Tax=Mus spicilegus TaxID=10103 RepID=A0A8C6I6M5_MUSSI
MVWGWKEAREENGRNGHGEAHPQRDLALALRGASQIPDGRGKSKHRVSTMSQSQKRGCCLERQEEFPKLGQNCIVDKMEEEQFTGRPPTRLHTDALPVKALVQMLR